MKFSQILNEYASYQKLINSLDNTPISVCGIEEPSQAHLVYTLKENKGVSSLVICYSDIEARAFADMVSTYTNDC